ncbi:hypothetical protein P5D95_25510, partial [Vibrio parahaemolyticus]|nr:hypothetical protein [Vibrio parahaemolyticus]
LATVDLSQVYTQLDLLNNLSNLTAADVALQLEAQGDEYIYAELEGVLEVIIRESLTDILTDLNNAVQALQATGSGVGGPIAAAAVNGTLNATLKPAFTLTYNTALALVNVGSALIGNLVDGSVLGETTVTIPTLIQDPTYQDLLTAGVDISNPYEAGFLATMIKSSLLAIDIASNYDGYTPVFYEASDVTAPYNVEVTGNVADGYEVTGMADPGATVRIY